MILCGFYGYCGENICFFFVFVDENSRKADTDCFSLNNGLQGFVGELYILCEADLIDNQTVIQCSFFSKMVKTTVPNRNYVDGERRRRTRENLLETGAK